MLGPFQQVQAAYDHLRAQCLRHAAQEAKTRARTYLPVDAIRKAERDALKRNQHPAVVVKSGTVSTPFQAVAARPRKGAALAILLAFFFGPLGMLYSDVRGAVVLFIVDLILLLPTLGLILLITWPVGVAWAAIATNSNSS